MNWEEARSAMLDSWIEIRERVASADPDPVDLLSRINAVQAFCTKAQEESGRGWDYCPSCLAHRQFGGCRGITREMSDRVAAKEWEGVGRLVDSLIHNLRNLQVPPGANPS